MSIALYPGSFDPFHNGHLYVVLDALDVFDKIIVGVAVNTQKQPMFTVEERVQMIKDVFKNFNMCDGKIEVVPIAGATVDACRRLKADILLRGVRSGADFECEAQVAQANIKLSDGAYSTMFVPARLEFSYVSSSLVREFIRLQKSLNGIVFFTVEKFIEAKQIKEGK